MRTRTERQNAGGVSPNPLRKGPENTQESIMVRVALAVKLEAKPGDLFASPPKIENVDVLAAKVPGS